MLNIIKKLLIIIILLQCQIVWSQSLSFTNKKVKLNGKTIVTLKKAPQPTNGYEVFNKRGKLPFLIVTKLYTPANGMQNWIFSFNQLPQRALEQTSIKQKRKELLKLIFNRSIIDTLGEVNLDSIYAFVMRSPYQSEINGQMTFNKKIEYPLVNRNLSLVVKTQENLVVQDNKVVGRYHMINKGKEATTLLFSLPDGMKIAESKYLDGAQNIQIVTLKDQQFHTLKVNSDTEIIQLIAAFLVASGYL